MRPGPRRSLAAIIVAAALALLATQPALAADSVYWGNYRFDYPFGGISFAKLDGSGGGDLFTGSATVRFPTGVAIDPATGRIYWANLGGKISFANLDGSGGGDLNTKGATVSDPTGVAIDPGAGRIYWANAGADEISYARLDGTGGFDINTGNATVSNPEGVAVDPGAGRIYWANADADKISYANLDGTGGGDVNTGNATVSNPEGVAVDPAAGRILGGRIYWANYGANKISYANLGIQPGGGDLNTAAATVNEPVGVAVEPAAGRIYWANWGPDKVSFANLDGSGGGDLATTPATTVGPSFPALLERPSGTGSPVITGGTSVGATLDCSNGSWAADLPAAFLYRAAETLAYQWRLNGTVIAGATGSSLTASAPGNYRCRVTATNQAGSRTQTSAAHAVLARLTITRAGAGFGTVISSPAGIDCGSSCSHAYTDGTRVTLTASPAQGSTFTGWSGSGCSGTGTCKVTMSSNHAVTATFAPIPPPNTTITGHTVSSANRSASFAFTDSGGVGALHFKCRLDGAAFASCSSPRSYSHLARGSHTFRVEAIDSRGKADPTPATFGFKVTG